MANYNGTKCSKIEFEKRVRAVQEWILLGYATIDIINQIKISWEVGDRQAYKYLKHAYEEFKESNQKSIEAKKAYHIALRKKLYRELKEKDLPTGARTALRIFDSIARIEGLTLRDVFDEPEDTAEKTAIMRLPDGTEIEL